LAASTFIWEDLVVILGTPSCEEAGNRTSQPPTTSQQHVLTRILPRNYTNVNTQTHTHDCMQWMKWHTSNIWHDTQADVAQLITACSDNLGTSACSMQDFGTRRTSTRLLKLRWILGWITLKCLNRPELIFKAGTTRARRYIVLAIG